MAKYKADASQQKVSEKSWETLLQNVLHSIRSLLCATTNSTPHERFFSNVKASSIPYYDKAIYVYGIRWLTRVCKVACGTEQAPNQWQTRVIIIPIHKKEDKSKCTNYRGISLISVPGKVYAKCLEKKCREIVEPKLTDAQCGFHPGRSTTDQIFAL